jgi:hypothetical protein
MVKSEAEGSSEYKVEGFDPGAAKAGASET